MPLRVFSKIKKLSKVARKLVMAKSNETKFGVIVRQMNGSVHFIMDLSKSSSDCLGYQVGGMPCKHALVCIIQSNLDPANYIDKSLTMDANQLTYSESIHHCLIWWIG